MILKKQAPKPQFKTSVHNQRVTSQINFRIEIKVSQAEVTTREERT